MPGCGLHLELTLLHRIGLSPHDALAAATSNYTEMFGWSDVGRVEPGRFANLPLLDASPRTDVSAVDHIHTLTLLAMDKTT
jgi:imidazolonepropionase-like amidohydrolase